jgi:hypothetical protein
VTEKDIEQYLVKEIKKLGGRCDKFQTPARRAAPDRICLLSYGLLIFVECKRPGKKPTPAQYKELDDLMSLGFWATWVSTRQEVNELIEQIKRYIRS